MTVTHPCPSCGKNLRLSSRAKAFACPSCGAALVLSGARLQQRRTAPPAHPSAAAPARGRLAPWLIVAGLGAAVILLATFVVILLNRGSGAPPGEPARDKLAGLEPSPIPSGKAEPSKLPVEDKAAKDKEAKKPDEEEKKVPSGKVVLGKGELAKETPPPVFKGLARDDPPVEPAVIKAGGEPVARAKGHARLEVRAAHHPGVDQKAVDRAIDQGVAFLKANVNEANLLGAKALAGLALLHCDVPAGDPVVERLAAEVRDEIGRRQMPYDLAAAIWFLDRLRDERDRPLIRSLGLRLIANQQDNGGWGYTTVALTPAQEAQLVALLGGEPVKDVVKVAPIDKPAPGGPIFIGAHTLPADLRQLPVLRYTPGKRLPIVETGGIRNFANRPDNSLTQFGLLGVWVSMRHGVPAQRSLLMVEERFRGSQAKDGAWAYETVYMADAKKPSVYVTLSLMRDTATCAGLLALGAGAAARDSKEADPAVERALGYLGHRLETLKPFPAEVRNSKSAAVGGVFRQFEKMARFKDPAAILNPGKDKGLFDLNDFFKMALEIGKGGGGGGMFGIDRGALFGAEAWGDLYFLWSLERMAVAYDLKTVGKRDWYAFGAPIIVACQNPDGGWREAFPGIPDTAFALLFLRRANLFVDLSTALERVPLPPAAGERQQPAINPGDQRGPGISSEQPVVPGQARGE